MLGIGGNETDFQMAFSPAKVSGNHSWISVSVGYHHTCGVDPHRTARAGLELGGDEGAQLQGACRKEQWQKGRECKAEGAGGSSASAPLILLHSGLQVANTLPVQSLKNPGESLVDACAACAILKML